MLKLNVFWHHWIEALVFGAIVCGNFRTFDNTQSILKYGINFFKGVLFFIKFATIFAWLHCEFMENTFRLMFCNLIVNVVNFVVAQILLTFWRFVFMRILFGRSNYSYLKPIWIKWPIANDIIQIIWYNIFIHISVETDDF